ncbi:hypothetical protein MAHJHV61_39880 [Mycobacterium avium subsp. hominissuis]|nr:hypothetical protein [Mycobacterium avium]
MPDDSRWERWLYETHRPAELHAWARRLRYFRFCRAVGGHANDGDRLLVALRAETEPSLRGLVACLGVAASAVTADAPTRRRGVAYSGADYAALPSPIGRFPHLCQPGHIEIDGHKAFMWVYADRVTVSLSDPDDPFSVTAAAIESALFLEARISPIAAQLIDPPLDTRHCICPKYYPELWA